MSDVATVWAPPPSQTPDWESGANPNAAAYSPGRARNPWREVRKGWAEIIRKIEAIRLLEDDWDGAGACQPDAKTIDSCIALANHFADAGFPPASCVSPTVEGGVVIQWQGDFSRFEIEANKPFRFECMLSVRGQKPKHWVIS
jgi:hypothetical protein